MFHELHPASGSSAAAGSGAGAGTGAGTGGSGFWYVTGYEDCVTVNRDWEHFSSYLGGALFQDMDPAGDVQRPQSHFINGTKHLPVASAPSAPLAR